MNNKMDSNRNEPENSFSVNQLIRDVGKQGLNAGKWFTFITVIFGFVNLLFFIIALFAYFNRESSSLDTIYILCMIFVGIGITVLALSFTYKYILIDTLFIGYKYLTPFFKKLSISIIDKVTSKAINFSSGDKIQNTLNTGSMFFDVYGRKVPTILQKAISYLLKLIPFSDFIYNMKSEFQENKDSGRLSEILYLQIDKYIKETVFLGSNMKWIRWLLPLNIVLQIIFIYLLKL